MGARQVRIGTVTMDIKHVHGAWFLEKSPHILLVRLWTGERIYTSDPEQIKLILMALGKENLGHKR